jgi:hypothetical protein
MAFMVLHIFTSALCIYREMFGSRLGALGVTMRFFEVADLVFFFAIYIRAIKVELQLYEFENAFVD